MTDDLSQRLRAEVPADLPDDWDVLVAAGDVRALCNALEAERLKRQQAEHERDSILEDLAGAEKDAKRYRWLRAVKDTDWGVQTKVIHDYGEKPENATCGIFGVATFIGRSQGTALDAAIDAAIAQEQKRD